MEVYIQYFWLLQDINNNQWNSKLFLIGQIYLWEICWAGQDVLKWAYTINVPYFQFETDLFQLAEKRGGGGGAVTGNLGDIKELCGVAGVLLLFSLFRFRRQGFLKSGLFLLLKNERKTKIFLTTCLRTRQFYDSSFHGNYGLWVESIALQDWPRLVRDSSRHDWQVLKVT